MAAINVNDIKQYIRRAACLIKTGKYLSALNAISIGESIVESRLHLFDTREAQDVFYNSYMKKFNALSWYAMVHYED